MAVDDDVRELRGHVMGLVGDFRQFSGRVEGKLEGIELTLEAHSRPCPDIVEVKGKIEKLSAGVNGKDDRGLLRLVLSKIVIPLIVALAGGFSAVVAYAFVKGNG